MNERRMELLLARYESNRVVRALVQLIPYGLGAAVDVIPARTIENIREQRSKTFFDELANSAPGLDAEVLESENFVHCYLVTTRYALNTRRHEKIVAFARLLKSSATPDGPQDTDAYEEFSQILDELT